MSGETSDFCKPFPFRLYLRRQTKRKRRVAVKTYSYVLAYAPAVNGQPAKRWHLPLQDWMRPIIEQQRNERNLRREAASILKFGRTGRSGRPPLHADKPLLEYLGLRRNGDHIGRVRSMPHEERARRYYGLLEPAWRECLTEVEYVALDAKVRALERKHRRRGGAPFDEAAAWQQVLGGHHAG